MCMKDEIRKAQNLPSVKAAKYEVSKSVDSVTDKHGPSLA